MKHAPDVRLSWWLQMLGLVGILAGTMVGLGIWTWRKMIRRLRRAVVGRVVIVGGLGVLISLGLAGCDFKITILPHCEWSEHPNGLFEHVFWCVSRTKAIEGIVEQSRRDQEWTAFIRGAYCGAGRFETKEAAMKCVDDKERETSK